MAAAVVLVIILISAGVIICLYRKKRDVTKSTRETSSTYAVRSLMYEDPLQTPISDMHSDATVKCIWRGGKGENSQ